MLIADLIVWDLLDFELGNNSSREVANCYFRVGKLLVSVGKLKNYRLPKKNNIHQKYDFESKCNMIVICNTYNTYNTYNTCNMLICLKHVR